MPTTIKSGTQMKAQELWFLDQYRKLCNPKYGQAPVLESLFKQIVWRIVKLEKQVEELKEK
ncbi:MAG: hypothetical protein ABIF04_06700 [Chloroflexota bacterium]